MHCISVIGTGYVGLVTGACLADFGMDVICVDNNIEKIQRLQKGEIPIYENGLDMVVKRNVGTGRLRFTSNLPAAVHDAEVVFLAVGTPPLEDGSVDLAALFSAVDEIAAGMDGYKVIVTKSTVPVGTTNRIKREISAKLDARGVKTGFDMISNPEFLREGSAVYDFMHPDRVILGYNSGKALEIMKSVYRVLYLNETPFIETNIQTAEMIKYASNAFLALKITYINQIANLCEAAGANVIDVSKAMGKDARIGSKFLHPGPGYGGSCFPKDTLALVWMARAAGCPVSLIEETIAANERQKNRMVSKIVEKMEKVAGKKIAILGLSFKPETDDMRDAPSLAIINQLADLGAQFQVFDPASIHEAKKHLGHHNGTINYCRNEYDTVCDADALVIMTEWNQFRNLDLKKIGSLMKGKLFFDFRNIYRRGYVEETGLSYVGVGS